MNTQQEPVKEFFAVTGGSAFRVSDEKWGFNKYKTWPTVEKIASKAGSMVNSSDNKWPIGTKLRNGMYVGITKIGIMLYEEDHVQPPEKRLRPEDTNTMFWGGCTSNTVALFLNQEEALKCLESDNLKNCDPRWQKETMTTIEVIGFKHPVFIVSVFPSLRIDYES